MPEDWHELSTKDPQILGATVQNLITQATWCPGFVHLYTFFFSEFLTASLHKPQIPIDSTLFPVAQNTAVSGNIHTQHNTVTSCWPCLKYSAHFSLYGDTFYRYTLSTRKFKTQLFRVRSTFRIRFVLWGTSKGWWPLSSSSTIPRSIRLSSRTSFTTTRGAAIMTDILVSTRRYCPAPYCSSWP
jgi:hypothetical protein